MEYGVLYVRVDSILLMDIYSVHSWVTMEQVHTSIAIYYHYKHTHIGPDIFYGSPFGETTGPIGWSYVYCHGWETSIHQCSKSTYPSFTCLIGNTVGLTCKEGELIYNTHIIYNICI